ncbi:MAG TPA: translation initiation factor IF-2 [Candidatus Megaira endosymbiont of Hartmannula sinica]|nr:translation initiation factor IF-2 [Candidatus Megaera endosymbiont of Hartmannula sinica]
MSEKTTSVTRELMKQGVIASNNQQVDIDIAEIIATNLGHNVKRINKINVEDIFKVEDQEEDLVTRPPIVTVMGHVDHGKTSLLDALKSTDIASRERGGITQHIGAYKVNLSNNKSITFIDTPGHEAFTEMRQRGANITDIVVLVVAADDSVNKQTIEAISHAKSAGVPIIVAINKIDKRGADIEKVKNDLLQYDLIPEDLGGDIICVGVSAKEKINLEGLEEAILLSAEMLDLKANINAPGAGYVIESHIDKNQGPVVNIINNRGTIKIGDVIVAGTSYGRIRKMTDCRAGVIKEASIGDAISIYGLTTTPTAGDEFNVITSEKKAKEVADYRDKMHKIKILQEQNKSKTGDVQSLFSDAVAKNKAKNLQIIIKADTSGSVQAIESSINKINSTEEVNVKIIHSAVGPVNQSDVSLSLATSAHIVAFNTKSTTVKNEDLRKANIKYYSIIYDLIDDIKSVIGGMLSKIVKETYIGSAAVKQIFNISKIGKIAGSYVTKGLAKRNSKVKLLRDGKIIHEGTLKTLKREKEDVKEVREGVECGIAIENYNNIEIDDVIEMYEISYEERKI